MWRILVVEDIKANQMLIAEILKDMAICEFANNGREGFNLYRKSVEKGKLYDLILLDIAMPILNGLQFLTLIREDEIYFKTKKTPIIVQTAHKDQIQEAIDKGCDDYMLKPLSPEQLIRKITLILS